VHRTISCGAIRGKESNTDEGVEEAGDRTQVWIELARGWGASREIETSCNSSSSYSSPPAPPPLLPSSSCRRHWSHCCQRRCCCCRGCRREVVVTRGRGVEGRRGQPLLGVGLCRRRATGRCTRVAMARNIIVVIRFYSSYSRIRYDLFPYLSIYLST